MSGAQALAMPVGSSLRAPARVSRQAARVTNTQSGDGPKVTRRFASRRSDGSDINEFRERSGDRHNARNSASRADGDDINEFRERSSDRSNAVRFGPTTPEIEVPTSRVDSRGSAGYTASIESSIFNSESGVQDDVQEAAAPSVTSPHHTPEKALFSREISPEADAAVPRYRSLDGDVLTRLDNLAEGQEHIKRLLVGLCSKQERIYVQGRDLAADLREELSPQGTGWRSSRRNSGNGAILLGEGLANQLRSEAGTGSRPGSRRGSRTSESGLFNQRASELFTVTETESDLIRSDEGLGSRFGLSSMACSMSPDLAMAEEAREVPNNEGTEFIAPGLPLSWPAVLPKRDGFDVTSIDRPERNWHGRLKNSQMSGEGSIRSNSRAQSTVRSATRSHESLPSVEAATRWHFLCRLLRTILESAVVDPTTMRHAVLEALSFVVLMYDLTCVPYILAWGVPKEEGIRNETGFLNTTLWISAIFWLLDMMRGFLKGYLISGEVVRDPRLTAWRYLRTWALPDAALVLSDWIELITRGTGVVKVCRVVKLDRVWWLYRAIMDNVQNKSTQLYLQFVFIIFGMLFLNHNVGCAWWAIGRLPSDFDVHWTDTMEYGVLTEQDRFFQYVTSLHWAVATFTGNEMDLSAVSPTERVFNITFVIFSLLFGCTLISSLSAAMVEFQTLMQDRTQKLRYLRKYLRDNHVDRRVVVLVEHMVKERLIGKENTTSTEELDATLMLLSPTLRGELNFDIFSPHLVSHPLFRFWTSYDSKIVESLCLDATEFVFLRTHDELFIPATEADGAFNIVCGPLAYVQEPETSPVEDVEEKTVGTGQWLCEAALWCTWIHVGRATAMGDFQAVLISAEIMVKGLKMNPVLHGITSAYCRNFHRRVVSARPPSAPWPTDLQVPFTDFGEIVTSMEHHAQVIIGLEALDRAAENNVGRLMGLGVGAKDLKLKGEVQSGKSIVLVNSSGEVERVVSVTVLRVKRHDGRLLVQLGKLGSGKRGTLGPVGSCQLPGLKQDRSDATPGETLQRILRTKLPRIKDKMELVEVERQIQCKKSKDYGMQTKYLRTVCHAEMSTPIEGEHFANYGTQDKESVSRSLSMKSMLTSNAPVARSMTGNGPQLGRTMSTKAGQTVSHKASAESHFVVSEDSFDFHSYLFRGVHIYQEASQICCYTWLDEEEFTFLSSPMGEGHLNFWLSALEVHDTTDSVLL